MGVEALAETAAIEYATGGMGTAAAITRLGKVIKSIGTGAEGAAKLNEAFEAAKGLKSAATIFGVMNRLNESKMEGMQNYDQIYQSLSDPNQTGGKVFTEEEKKHLASEGAKLDYKWNLALLPLDILSYRTMVFNPISGSATNWVERGLEGIAGVFGKSKLGRAAGWTVDKLIGANIEGLEEGVQQVAQDEGQHYANVLGGMDDGNNFMQRLGKSTKSDDFWNSYIGGVLAAPVLGVGMNMINRITTGNRVGKMNAINKNYVKEAGMMNAGMQDKISELDKAGKVQEAAQSRRVYNALDTLSRIHSDEELDKNTAYTSRLNFLEATLGELNEGKTTSLQDTGFFNITKEDNPDTVEINKESFKNYIDDTKLMKSIYDNVKGKYNKNFVPAITYDHFMLNRMQNELADSNVEVLANKNKLAEYNQLSPSGKQIHDIDYELQASKLEQDRLSRLYKATVDDREKENISKLIDNNENKRSELSTRLAEVQADENYNAKDKETDNDILRARIGGNTDSELNTEYLQSLYNKENLENSIALKRKNIGLWSNPEYIKDKTKQAIKHAKTVDQVKNNVEAPIKNKKGKVAKPTADIVEAAKQKEVEISASADRSNEVAQKLGDARVDDEESNFLADTIIQNANNNVIDGNSSLGDDDTDYQTPIQTDSASIPDVFGEKVFQLAPVVYDFNSSSQEAKDKIKAGVAGLLNKLGGKNSFEDLVREFAKLKGLENTENIYEALKYGYRGNGKSLSDEEANLIQDKIFGNVYADDIMTAASDLIVNDPNKLTTATNGVTDDIVEKQGQPEGFDNNNQPIYEYNSRVLDETAPTGAYVSRPSQRTYTDQEDGTRKINFEYTGQMGEGNNEWINSDIILDPDSTNKGTRTDIKIPIGVDRIPVSIFNGIGEYVKSMPFGQWVAEKVAEHGQDFVNSQEYKDKIPMIHYPRDFSNGGKGIMFVHDVQWISPNNFLQSKPDGMKQAIANLRAIREEVISSSTHSTPSIITGKRQTTFEGLIDRNKDNPPITLREANPQTQLMVAMTNGSTLNSSRNTIEFPNDSTALVNDPNKPFTKGQILDVRRYGLKDGVKTFIASPIFKGKIDKTTQQNIFNAIYIYIDSKNPSYKTIIDNIKSGMGLDITTRDGLRTYLSHFIRVQTFSGANSNADVDRMAKSSLAHSTPFITFIGGNNIVFGQAGVAMYIDQKIREKSFRQYISEGINVEKAGQLADEDAKVYSKFINRASEATAKKTVLDLIKPITVSEKIDNKIVNTTYPNRLAWFENNLDIDSYPTNLAEPKPIINIVRDPKTGVPSTEVAAKSYRDYLLDKFTTNLKSYNIGTEEKPNYVTNMQPVITFDTEKRLNAQINGQIKEETKIEKTEPVKVNQPVNPIEINVIGLSDEAKAKIDEIKKRLGTDLGRSTIYTLSPTVLDDAQKNDLSKELDNIAGLDPIEQNTIVTDIYTSIISKVNFDSGKVNKADLQAEIKRSFTDNILSVKKGDQEAIDYLNSIANTMTTEELQNNGIQGLINDAKLRIEKVDSINSNYKTLENMAFTFVDKYTGIKQSREKLEVNESEDNYYEYADKDTENPTDFYTDVLAESPNNKVTYAMRRFFGDIRKYDKEDNLAVGFLGRPLYTPSAQIVTSLQNSLVDTPSDFKTMLDKLRTLTDKYNWMQAVINKLEDTSLSEQKKNQFVSAMSFTRLRMIHTTLAFDRKTSSWNVRVENTNTNGIADKVQENWKNNLTSNSNYNLFIRDSNGNDILNVDKANSLIATYEDWIGLNIPVVQTDLSGIREAVKAVTLATSITLTPIGSLLNELKSNIIKKSDRMQFSMFNRDFQITSLGNGKYKISSLDRQILPTNSQIEKWLNAFGITLTPKTLEVLQRDGLIHNKQRVKPKQLMEVGNTNGLYGILYNSLKNLVNTNGLIDFTVYGGNPLDNSVIESLANLEARYNTEEVSSGFRANNKTYWGLTAPKFATDRALDLVDINSPIREQLGKVSFSKDSLWLFLLDDNKFKEQFGVKTDGAETLREEGKKSYRNRASIMDLSPMDHELAKWEKFAFMNDKVIRYGKADNSNYPGTTIPLRMSTMAGLTSSDKSIMLDFETAVLNLNTTDLQDGMSDQLIKTIYEQTVKPELERMSKFALRMKEKEVNNITDYEKGAKMFFIIPEMNNVMAKGGLKLTDAIMSNPYYYNTQLVESSEIKDAVYDTIRKSIDGLVSKKLQVWNEIGIKEVQDRQGNKYIDFMDKKYANKFGDASNADKLKYAAMDYEINSLIANANNMMLFAGDPALYFKSKSIDSIQKIKDSFNNVTKRLANQVAPAHKLANSKGDRYKQLFIKDKVSSASNIDYLEKLYGKDKVDAFREIKSADAQEYTTWKEHLDNITRLGKTADFLMDITPEDIDIARKLISSGKDFSDREMEIVRKVMQPLKPRYTGQIYDPEQDVMRTVYIKSSSFPLIPQLTKGFEIDKLRKKMEQIEKKGLNVRASYQTANKVGSMNNAADIWNKDGTINQEALDKIEDSSLVLDREGYGIQQDVPYKSYKNKVDTVTLGTQLMKILFGDGVMDIDGFNLDGKEYTGKELYEQYTNAFMDLIDLKQGEIFDELGLKENGVPIDEAETTNKLQNLLNNEALKRNYPLQDIKALKLDTKTGTFTLPLWASANSNRFEAMLNSIIGNRMVAMKLPGTSLVTGSEEGFIQRKGLGDLTQKEKSNIVFTSAWDGQRLKATNTIDGKLQMAQVFLPSKFRDNNGELIDLLDSKYTNNDNGHLTLKEEMFDKELLSSLSFRIPTSGHQSGTRIEIAGFLPHTMGDLIIVPNTFVTQKGLDIDIDKENLYNLWTRVNKDGKFEVLNEKHKTEILDEAINTKEGLITDLANELTPEYNEEEINEDNKLKKANSSFNEKLLHNKIIKITRAVYENPSNKMQSKINKSLGTQYAEDQANFINSLISDKDKNEIWSPLSTEYQKEAMLMGASGKIGKGIYSLDVVGHSLFQQAKSNGRPLILREAIIEDENTKYIDKVFKFGNVQSTGIMGSSMTIDGDRSNSEVISERQNIAVDNASLNVMGKVNLNNLTMNVDKVFIHQGIDKGDKVDIGDGKIVDSIPFLFLSQPIIREYVRNMQNGGSIMAKYDKNKEAKIIDSLIRKYDPREVEELEDNYDELMSSQMTNSNFIEAIKSEAPNGKLQAAVLRRFLEMKTYGEKIGKIESAINFKNNSLGKSFFDVIEKKNTINGLGYPSGIIINADTLIGDYIDKANVEEAPEGYTLMGNFYVKPNTVMGAFNVKATMTAYNLWRRYFPYDTDIMQNIFKQVIDNVGSEDMSSTRVVETKQEVFRHIKKYLSSSNKNGIVSNTDNVNRERERLYIDSDTNTSLAKYMQQLMQTSGNDVIDRYIKTNMLLNSFEYKINKDGQPSLIKYNNASGEQFDEQYLYEGLTQLLIKNGRNGTLELPQIGNKKYTLDTLAQDLIAYTYLGNSTQEAIQFAKYIPVSYLNIVGYSNWVSNNLERSLGLSINVANPENQEHLLNEFPMQYVQHTANKVKTKYDNDNWDKKTKEQTYTGKHSLDNLQTFKLVDYESPAFVSIYNQFGKTKKDKQQLYWFDGNKYTRVATLGTFGMDEYQLGQGIGTSIINGNVKLQIQPQQSSGTIVEQQRDVDPFKVASKNIETVLQSIVDSNIAGYSELATHLAPFVGETKIDTATGLAGKTNFYGVYLGDEDTIYINNKNLQNKNLEERARVILEEVTHSLTVNQINKYITQNPNGSVDVQLNAPAYVSDIVRLYNNVRSKVDTQELQDVLRKVNSNSNITKDELMTKYGLINIYEFMAHTFTNKDFQKYLARDEFKQSGKTFLERFKAIVLDLLNKMGINFSNDTATVQAFNSIFEFVENENDKSNISKENQKMKDDVDNFEEDTFFNDEEPNFSPTTFPNKTLNIIEEKCI